MDWDSRKPEGARAYSAPFIAAALVIAVTALLSFVYLREIVKPEE